MINLVPFVAPLRPARLVDGHLFVLLVLLLRHPFPGVLLLLPLSRGLIGRRLSLVGLVLRCDEPRPAVSQVRVRGQIYYRAREQLCNRSSRVSIFNSYSSVNYGTVHVYNL
jgi:hypothetical protein